MKPATAIFTFLFLAVLIIGGIASLDLIPLEWFDWLPSWIKIVLAACLIIFSNIMLLGYVLDSGVVQRVFRKKKQPGQFSMLDGQTRLLDDLLKEHHSK